MKYFYALIAIVLFSCSKQDKVAPVAVNALIVNDVEFTPSTKFAVGQILNIKPSMANGAAGANFTWILTPNNEEVFQQLNAQFSWRPAKAQQYTLTVNTTSASGLQAGKDYTFNLIPADIRYYLWGARRTDVEYTESASASEKVEPYPAYDSYFINRSDVGNGRKDAVQAGEHVGYWFENDRLVGADVYQLIQSTDPAEYYRRYEAVMERLSEYNHLGSENKWLTEELREQYENNREKLGEAFSNGYVTFTDYFSNERTDIKVEMLGNDDWTSLLVIRYDQRR